MTANTNARTRLLCLVEILTMYSDEHNILSIEEICEWLQNYGYSVTKRNVLADIKAVNTTPIQIVSVSKPKKGYYIAKYFSQDAIGLILEAIFSSEILTEDDVEYIKNYLKRCTCGATLDLVLNTTMNLNSLAQKRRIPGETVQKLRLAIRDKKQAVLTVSRAVPGDIFSADTRKTETVTVNPITIVVADKTVALLISRDETPQKAEYINISRIENVTVTKRDLTEFSGNYAPAVNYFDNTPSSINVASTDWLVIRFRTEWIETIERHFSSSVEFKKDDKEGYSAAKIFTPIDYSLIGWLYTLKDEIEIIAPEGLKKIFRK